MKRPSGLFKDRSADQTVKLFLDRFSGAASSPAARDFLDAFEESASSPGLSESERTSALSRLEALRAIFSARFENAFRPAPEKKTDLSPPSGLALAPDGSLAVSDDFNHRVQIYDRHGALVRQFSGKGKNPGQLTYPKGLTTDSGGNIYVADSWNHRVQKFDPRGNPLLSFGGYGEGRGQMNEPYDVHIDPMGNLVVVERYNHRLQFFSPDGKSLGWVGNRGTALEARLAWLYDTPPVLLDPVVFEFPTSIARDSQNAYYVADSGNHRIVKFDSEWRQVLTWGERGAGPGQFQYPLCVTSGPGGMLFVADLNNDRIQAFTSQGQFLFALAEADASTPLKMPGLTLAGPDGTLYAALTFDTRILRFKAPVLTEEAILENQVLLNRERSLALSSLGQLYEECGDLESAARKYEESFQALLEEKTETGGNASSGWRKNLPLVLNRLASDFAGNNEDLLLKGLGLFDDLLRESRQKVLSGVREWENTGSEFLQRLFAREAAILQETEDPRVFDRSFHLAERAHKERYREIRGLFHDYRTVAEKFGEYAFALFSRPLPDAGKERLRQTLRRRLDDIRETIDLHIDKKEKNEEAMVRTFSAPQDDGKKWEEFRLKFHANVQALDALKHFHFELRVLLKICKAALLDPANAPAFAGFLKETFATPEGSRPLGRILLRTQEDWGDHSGLNSLLLDLMDSAFRLPESGGPRKRALRGDYFSPLSFDSEDMEYEDIFRSLAIEGTPMEQTADGLLCGDEIHAPWDGDAQETARRLDEVFQYQKAYEDKNVELFAQLDQLREQRMDLDDALRKADTRDPKAPIPIVKTSQAVDFQINLVRRMLMTLRINEARNLSRLTLGGAAFSLQSSAKGGPLLESFLKKLREYDSTLESEIAGLHDRRKTRYLEVASLENQTEELGANLSADNFEKSLDTKRGVVRAQWAFEQIQFNLDRRYRTRNFLRKLLRLTGDASAFGPLDPETRGDGLRLKRHFGRCGPPAGKFISPLGLTYTRDGDLLAADHNGNSICRFSGEGIFKSSFGSFGNSPGAFQYPTSVAEDSKGNVLVADSHNVRVQKFTARGKFILAFGDRGGPEEKTGTAFSISVDREDNVWIADTANHRLLVFDPEGRFVRAIGRRGEDPGSLAQPTCVHCLENGDYIVGDRSDSPLKRFDAGGNLLRAFKRGPVPRGDIFYIAVHPESGVFAADSWNNQILRLNGRLELVRMHNRAGRRAEDLGIVGGLAIHGSSLAVANHDSHKIQLFELPR
ncbi:MAG: NHL repeat-containing protein [Nitrospinae bacterium]|nr:NHL repeat-containing protein [Nitrospinota bacterium]